MLLNIDQLEEQVEKVSYIDNEASINRDYDPWILEPLIPFRSITILDGLGGSGKSWFALDLCYSIGLGQAFLGIFPVKRQGMIMYFTAEEVPEVFVKRLDMIRKHYPANKNFMWTSMLHKDLDIVSSLCEEDRGNLRVTPMFEILERRINKVKPVLVVLDSMVNFYGLDENSSKEARFFIDALKGLARKYETSFLLLHHQNKEGMRAQADDVISFRGSGVFREQARSRIIYKNVKFEGGIIARKIILEKSNYYSKIRDILPEDGLYLKFDGGVHVYDREFAEHAKKLEEEAKQKGKKKGNNNNNGKQASTRANL